MLIICISPFLRNPEQVPSIVSLLSESYNPHVRCGAAMALGIGCAGTGSKVCCSSFQNFVFFFVIWFYFNLLVISGDLLIRSYNASLPPLLQKIKIKYLEYKKLGGHKR